MKKYDQMSDFEMSVLSEIGNVGAGNAATALSHILADRVNMSVPDLRILDVSKMTTLLGGPENEVVGILVNMDKDVRGMMLFLLERRFVCKLIEVLLDEKINDFSEISDMGRSAIMEIGNILAGSYVNAIATMTNLNIELTTPQIAIDMVGAILSYPAAQFGSMGDKLLLIEEDFISSEDTIRSHLLIMPELDSLQTMLESLGVA
jgi:chemotaxis protein CheC